MNHATLSADQLHLLAAIASNGSAAAAAEQLGCDLLSLGERLVDIRSRLGVGSTAAAVSAMRTQGLI